MCNVSHTHKINSACTCSLNSAIHVLWTYLHVGRPIDLNTCMSKYLLYMVIAIWPTVHEFPQAVYTVMEGEILNTRFQLNVKGMTRFPGFLNIQGIITSMAGGDASEYTHQCVLLYSIVYIISPSTWL